MPQGYYPATSAAASRFERLIFVLETNVLPLNYAAEYARFRRASLFNQDATFDLAGLCGKAGAVKLSKAVYYYCRE